MLVNNDVKITVKHNAFAEVDFENMCQTNIPNYQTITEIPKEHMDYINSVKYAVNCMDMFNGCEQLTSLDLASFDTSKVTNMSNMFANCTSLKRITGVLDLSSCNNVSSCFLYCDNLRSVHLKNVPRSIIDDGTSGLGPEGSLLDSGGTLDETYVIDNILEDR